MVSGSWPGEIFLFSGKPDRSFGPPEKPKDKDGQGNNVGGGDGSVLFYRHIGTAREPKLAEAVTLLPPGTIEYDLDKIAKEPTRGVRAKVCVVDYNGDGYPDLLVGDLSNQKPNRLELTA